MNSVIEAWAEHDLTVQLDAGLRESADLLQETVSQCYSVVESIVGNSR